MPKWLHAQQTNQFIYTNNYFIEGHSSPKMGKQDQGKKLYFPPESGNIDSYGNA